MGATRPAASLFWGGNGPGIKLPQQSTNGSTNGDARSQYTDELAAEGTELRVERNKPGQHRHSADRSVIDLVSDLSKICPDKTIAAILNRLGYKTGQEETWNTSRVAGLREYHNIAPFQN